MSSVQRKRALPAGPPESKPKPKLKSPPPKLKSPPPKPTGKKKGPEYLPGEIIADKYKLVRSLGEGGMGSVWVAKNLALEVNVAIKLIRTGLGNAETSKRLLTEAQLTARIGHSAIVQIFDFGRTSKGDPFIVMELLDGENLAEIIDRDGRLAATHAVQLLLPLADALHAAHLKGVVHRDLKPDNIFVTRSDAGRQQPKIVDFGIAKVEHAEKTGLTEEGTLLGSPDYMSPEQARGQLDVDYRSDIWSFCVVLYEVLTGKIPFEGQNYNAQLMAIVENEPLATTELAAGDEELWEIIERGLRKDREQRWGSMKALGEALAAWIYGRGIKEDICAQSIRTNWLENSGVHYAIDTQPPPGPTARRSGATLSGAASSVEPLLVQSERATDPPDIDIDIDPQLLSVAAPPAPGLPSSPDLDVPAMAPRKSRWPLVLIVLAAVGAAGAAGFYLARQSDSPADSTPAAIPTTPPAGPAPTEETPEARDEPAKAKEAPASDEAEKPADDDPPERVPPTVRRPKPTNRSTVPKGATTPPPVKPPAPAKPAPKKPDKPFDGEEFGF